jgi:hypothetical protein
MSPYRISAEVHRTRVVTGVTGVVVLSAVAMTAGPATATGSKANAKHVPVTCRAGYVRRTVRVPQRKHGRIVRRHGKIVYTYVRRCVRRPVTRFPPVIGTSLLLPFPPASPTPPGSPAPPGAPANTTIPAISGNPNQGGMLGASTGTWTNAPASYGYQWERCDASGAACQDVPGANAPNYLVGVIDAGSTIRVSVTAGNAWGSATATSAAVGPVPTSSGDPIVVAAGDVACPAGDTSHACRQSATATLAASLSPTAVLVLGDNQYDDGLYSEYTGAGAYGQTWGAFNPIVHPVPGNHEYLASGAAAGYFQYFSSNSVVTNSPQDYYSFNLGDWHILALNSNCSDTKGCSDALTGGTTSAQNAWLQSDLAANTKPCVLAMWHHPLFSSGWTLGTPSVAPLWTALYNAGADVVLNGHDHLYERYAQQDPTGNASANGIREFVVGTGGESLNGLSAHPSTLQASDASDFGVLALTLHAASYSWAFRTTGGKTVDSGTTACHHAGMAPASVATIRHTDSARAIGLAGPQLVFDARPLPASRATVARHGLSVAVHCSRACDVRVTAWLGHGSQLRRVASFYETESQIPRPYSQILLALPPRALVGTNAARLVLRFSALDAGGHHRVLTRTVSLR